MTNKSKNTNTIKFEDMPDVLNVCEVSITLQCSKYFVRKLIKENKISGTICGKGYRIYKKSVLNFLEGGAAIWQISYVSP